MMNHAQREQIQAILSAGQDLCVATNREDGYPQATVVSYVSDGLAIYFGTWSKSQKAINLSRDDRVSIAITLPYAAWDQIRGLSLGGRARRVTDADETQRVFGLMLKKFPQIQNFLADMQGADMALFRIDAEVGSILDYSKGFGHTETVQIAA